MKAVYGIFAITFLLLFVQLICTLKDILVFKKSNQNFNILFEGTFNKWINSDIKILLLLLISSLLMCINNAVHFFGWC